MPIMNEEERFGAVIVSIEKDPKKKAMYRITFRTSAGETDSSTDREADESTAEREAESEAEPGAQGEPRTETVAIHEDTLVAWRLLPGKRLNVRELKALRQEQETEEAYRAALGMLDRKPRTKREIAVALKRKGLSAEAIAGCLDRLASYRIVDDAAYAKRYAEQKVVSQRKGSRLVRQELLRRGVTKREADDAIEELDGEAERQAAYALAKKRWPNVKGESLRERRYKLMGMLQRRGFPAGIARDAAGRVIDEDEARDGREEDDWDEYFE